MAQISLAQLYYRLEWELDSFEPDIQDALADYKKLVSYKTIVTIYRLTVDSLEELPQQNKMRIILFTVYTQFLFFYAHVHV